MPRVDVGDVLGMRVNPLIISDPEISALFGNVPGDEQFSISLTGPEGSAKTSFSYRLVREFVMHGEVNYVTTEERLMTGSTQEKLNFWGIGPHNLSFLETQNFEEICRDLRDNPCRFCFIDSINEILDDQEDEIETKRIVRKLRGDFRETNFIFICQYDPFLKTTRGSKSVQHIVDLPLRTRGGEGEEKFVRRGKSRYGGTISEIPVFPKSGRRR